MLSLILEDDVLDGSELWITFKSEEAEKKKRTTTNGG